MELAYRKDERLSALEAIIKTGLETFWRVGQALAEIRDNRLYKEDYPTFESYCAERWGMSKTNANYLVASATVIENLQNDNNCCQLPTNEHQARPLTRLGPDAQAEAWARAVETAPDGVITGRHVLSVVKVYIAEQPKGKAPKARRESSYSQEKAWLSIVKKMETLSKEIQDRGRFPAMVSSEVMDRLEASFKDYSLYQTLIREEPENGLGQDQG